MSDNTPDLETQLHTAEDHAQQLASETEELRTRLEQTQQSYAVERELAAAGAIDMEIATALIAASLAGTKREDANNTPDPATRASKAVAELKARKPFLFAATIARRIAGAMAPAPRIVSPPLPTREQLADQARSTGDRGALMRYLKSRRAA